MTKQNLTRRRGGAEGKVPFAFSAPPRLRVRILGQFLLWFAFITSAFAQTEQPETSPEDKALREKWQQVYQKIAGSIEMRRGENPLALEPTPLLFYTNP